LAFAHFELQLAPHVVNTSIIIRMSNKESSTPQSAAHLAQLAKSQSAHLDKMIADQQAAIQRFNKLTNTQILTPINNSNRATSNANAIVSNIKTEPNIANNNINGMLVHDITAEYSLNKAQFESRFNELQQQLQHLNRTNPIKAQSPLKITREAAPPMKSSPATLGSFSETPRAALPTPAPFIMQSKASHSADSNVQPVIVTAALNNLHIEQQKSSQLQQKNTELTAEMTLLQAMLRSKQTEINNLTNHNATLAQQNQLLLQGQAKEVANSKKQFVQAQNDADLSQQYVKQIENYKFQQSLLENQLTAVQKAKFELSLRVNQLENNSNQLALELQSYKTKLSQQSLAAEAALDKQNLLYQLKIQNSELKNEQENLQNLLTDATKRMEEEIRAKHEATSQFLQYKAKIEQKSSNVEQFNTLNSQLQQENDQKNKEINQKTSIITELHEKIEKLQQNRQDNQRINELERENANLLKRNALFNEENALSSSNPENSLSANTSTAAAGPVSSSSPLLELENELAAQQQLITQLSSVVDHEHSVELRQSVLLQLLASKHRVNSLEDQLNQIKQNDWVTEKNQAALQELLLSLVALQPSKQYIPLNKVPNSNKTRRPASKKPKTIKFSDSNGLKAAKQPVISAPSAATPASKEVRSSQLHSVLKKMITPLTKALKQEPNRQKIKENWEAGEQEMIDPKNITALGIGEGGFGGQSSNGANSVNESFTSIHIPTSQILNQQFANSSRAASSKRIQAKASKKAKSKKKLSRNGCAARPKSLVSSSSASTHKH
jgi:hypothetical protein